MQSFFILTVMILDKLVARLGQGRSHFLQFANRKIIPPRTAKTIRAQKIYPKGVKILRTLSSPATGGGRGGSHQAQ